PAPVQNQRRFPARQHVRNNFAYAESEYVRQAHKIDTPDFLNEKTDDGDNSQRHQHSSSQPPPVNYSYQKQAQPAQRSAGQTGSAQTTNKQNLLRLDNLPLSLTDGDLRGIFWQFNVLGANIAKTADGESIGVGFVKFDREEDLNRALKQMQFLVVRGLRVPVSLASVNQ
ncbi:MAG: hypothetical protein EZS28_036048, partial [Streblomastix strix]